MRKANKATRTEAEWDHRYCANRPIWSLDLSPVLKRYVALLAAERAHYLGAAKGCNAIWLTQQGCNVTAVDLSSVAIAKAREFAAEAKAFNRSDFKTEDVTQVILDTSSHALVLLMYFHLPPQNLLSFVRTAVDALRPGRAFVLTGHDESNLQDGFDGPQAPTFSMVPSLSCGPRVLRQRFQTQSAFKDPSKHVPDRAPQSSVGSHLCASRRNISSSEHD